MIPAVAAAPGSYSIRCTFACIPRCFHHIPRPGVHVGCGPAMQADLGLSQIQFGWVFTVFYVAYGVCEIPTACLVTAGDNGGC